ncbi:MAG TPA: hypothetical protein DDW97_00985 [Anaerolineaceae bacterium]|nr:hypothetical protein [Anaerolineaceae bacterium]
MFPAMVRALNMAEIKGVRNKTAAYIGSYSWSGGAKSVFEGYSERLNWDVVGTHEFIGSAKADDLEQIRTLSRELARRSR